MMTARMRALLVLAVFMLPGCTLLLPAVTKRENQRLRDSYEPAGMQS